MLRRALGLVLLIGSMAGCVPERPFGASDEPTPTVDDTLPIVTVTPAPTATIRNEAVEYVVREGDTLGAISEQFGVDPEAISEANGIADPNSIFVGQRLVIPAPATPIPAGTPSAS